MRRDVVRRSSPAAFFPLMNFGACVQDVLSTGSVIVCGAEAGGMSFPSRGPPLMPGMPGMPLMQPAYPLPPLMQQAMPLVPSVMFAPRAALPIRQHGRQQPPQSTYSRRTKEPLGPPVTVFIGNITERAPDGMVRLILNSCGTVHNWKRVQGASGKLQAFGFCEFGNPDAALRAIRLLHDLDVSDKKLVAKVDAKTQEVLEKYKNEKRSSQRRSPLQDEQAPADADDYVDPDMKADDESALKRIRQILADYAQEMASYTPRGRRERGRRSDGERSGPRSRRSDAAGAGRRRLDRGDRDSSRQRAQEKVIELSKTGVTVDDQPANLEGMEVEEDKKDLISREIGKFRDQMKRQEEEKERTRRERPERDSTPSAAAARSRSRRSRSRSHSERSPAAAARRRSRSRSATGESAAAGSSSSSRARPGRPHEHKRRSRSREEEPAPRKSDRDLKREKEEDEEAKERKKLDRKAREKEAAYQERLRNWETREQKRQRDVKKEAEREKQRENEAQREAKKLKEFLEDYDDEKDDPKYYKGRELQRRLAAREREAEEDARDSQREKEELEELRARIQAEGHNDPSAEYERQRAEREEQYRPRLRVKPERPPSPPVVELTTSPAPPPAPPLPEHTASSDGGRSPSPPPPPEDSLMAGATPLSSRAESTTRSVEVTPRGLVTPVTPAGPADTARAVGTGSGGAATAAAAPGAVKKKKLDVKDVFNQDDDDGHQKKKRKLVPLDHDDDTKKKEEKKRAVKSLIEKIPTGKEELFSYTVDWDAVDNTLMERRIRPWISKKIAEYIGEPEPTLVEFICSKILVGSTPQAILDDVQMVLDEEADVFVVKMWRLLIYEIQAKKSGLGK